MIEKRKVAVIGTGGTISSVGRHPFDLIDYDANGKMLGKHSEAGEHKEKGEKY